MIGIFISGIALAQENDFKASKNKMTRRAWRDDFDHFYNIITTIISRNLMKQASGYYYGLHPGVKEYNENWIPLYEEYSRNHYLIEYDATIAYEKGAYKVVGGLGNWEGRYGKNSKVIEVNGLPIDIAVKSCYEKYHLDYDYRRNRPFVSIVHPKIFGPDAEFKIMTTRGTIKVVHLKTVSNPKLFPPGEEPEPQQRVVTKSRPERKAAYVWIYNFWGDTDHDPLMSFYKQIEGYDLLIIDVRGNRGGAMPPKVQTDDFTIFQYPQRVFPTHESRFGGKTAILTDEVTYSAADAFVLIGYVFLGQKNRTSDSHIRKQWKIVSG